MTPLKQIADTLTKAQPMTDWQPIETAPKDGTEFQARIPGHGEDNVIAWHDGLINSEGGDCGSWAFTREDQEPPDCWTDGWCWDVNEDGVPSAHPTAWKPLPQDQDNAHT